MGFIHRHQIFIGIFSFLFIGLPQYIESIWSLVERLQEVEITTQFPLGWLYWITMPIGLGMLIFIILQSRKVSKAVIVQPTQVAVAQQYSSQVRETLNALIQRGEELCSKMQVREFSVWHLEPVVREWLDESSQKVYKILPDLADYILADQGGFTEGEKSQYQGWKWDNFSLRINVDRRLARLRETQSKIQAEPKPAIGGLIGHSKGGKVKDSHFRGKIIIEGKPKEADVGSLIGKSENTEVEDSSADAEIEYKQD